MYFNVFLHALGKKNFVSKSDVDFFYWKNSQKPKCVNLYVFKGCQMNLSTNLVSSQTWVNNRSNF